MLSSSSKCNTFANIMFCLILTVTLHYTIISNAQYSENIFVSFSSNTSNNALNNGSKVDTIFYADYPDSTFINKSIEEKNLSYKFDNDTYIYTLHNNKIIEEKVYLGNQKRTLFRKKTTIIKRDSCKK